jgi:ankyrin repeat protein
MLADQPEKRITSSEVVHQLERNRIQVNQMKLFAQLKEQTNPSEEGIKILIKKGFDLNCVDEYGLTPLLYLIEKKGNDTSLLKLLQFLIENGIDVNCKGIYGWNVLHLLCQHFSHQNRNQIEKLLNQHMGDVTR